MHLILTVAGLAGLLLSQIAWAHHASSGLYDRATTVTMSGEIRSVFWRNPHVRLSIAIANEDDGEEIWDIEAGSVNTLERIGVTADRFAVGDAIQVSGFAGRDGRKIMFASGIASAAGDAVTLGADINQRYARPEQIAAGRALDSGPATDIFRVWVPTRLPNTGAGRANFPLTDAARAARAAWDPTEDLALSCIPPGMPSAMDNPYPIEFENRGDEIVLRLEEWDGVRTIQMNAVARTEAPNPTPMGYSTGRWEGDTLIVETSRIAYPYFDDLGTPQSSGLRMTEYFTLSSNERRLSWEAHIDDPETFTESVMLQIVWQWIPGHEIKPFNCALAEAQD